MTGFYLKRNTRLLNGLMNIADTFEKPTSKSYHYIQNRIIMA